MTEDERLVREYLDNLQTAVERGEITLQEYDRLAGIALNQMPASAKEANIVPRADTTPATPATPTPTAERLPAIPKVTEDTGIYAARRFWPVGYRRGRQCCCVVGGVDHPRGRTVLFLDHVGHGSWGDLPCAQVDAVVIP